MKDRIQALTRQLSFNKTILFSLVGCLMAATVVVFFLVHISVAVSPSYQKVDQRVDQPFLIKLNTSLRSVSLDEIKITPAVEGDWEYKSGHMVGYDSLAFKPKDYFKVNTIYTIEFGRVERILTGSAKIKPVIFKTEAAPKINEAGIFGLKDGSTIPADQPIVAQLTSPNRGLRNLYIKTEPSLVFKESISEDKIYRWKTDGLLPQGNALKVQIIDSKNDTILITKTFHIAAEPSLVSSVKQQYFTPQDEAAIVFNQPIESESSKYISFDIAGLGSWRDATTYVFKPNNVEPGKTYGYKIAAGLRSKDGGVLTADKLLQFSTTGNVATVNISPDGNGLSQSKQQIMFRFNQAVDHNSAQERFSISSGDVAGFSWSGNTMIVSVSGLGFQRTVVANVSAGVRPAGFGLPSVRNFSTTFTTETRSVKLSAPFFRQQFKGSCVAASLRMVLAAKGIGASDMDIIYRMGYEPRSADRSTDPPTWDDPDSMYVGNVDGSIRDFTGAGPDAGPVAKAARSYGLNATAVTGAGIGWLSEQIHAGRFVILFGAFANTGFTSWQTSSGKVVRMNITSHARLITGVQGEPGSPIGFWVSDPLSSNSYWSSAKLAANISLDAYHQAVVIY